MVNIVDIYKNKSFCSKLLNNKIRNLNEFYAECGCPKKEVDKYLLTSLSETELENIAGGKSVHGEKIVLKYVSAALSALALCSSISFEKSSATGLISKMNQFSNVPKINTNSKNESMSAQEAMNRLQSIKKLAPYKTVHIYSKSEAQHGREVVGELERLANDIGNAIKDPIVAGSLFNTINQITFKPYSEHLLERNVYADCLEAERDLRDLIIKFSSVLAGQIDDDMNNNQLIAAYQNDIRTHRMELLEECDAMLRELEAAEDSLSTGKTKPSSNSVAEDDDTIFGSKINELRNNIFELKTSIEKVEVPSDEILSKWSEMNCKQYISSSFDKFGGKINNIKSQCSKLIKEIMKVVKDLEAQFLDTERDSLLSRVSSWDRQISDAFSANGISGPLVQTIHTMGEELRKRLDVLEADTCKLNSFDARDKLLTDFKLFERTLNSSVTRKQNLVTRYLEEQGKETHLENLHDFEAQLEMLRNNKLTLEDVVGGYSGVKSRIRSIISAHEKRERTGKGTPSKGLILYGKPGTGKTTIARAVSASLKKNLVMLKRGTDDRLMEQEVHAKFNEAKSLTNGGKDTVILLVDEIDALGAIRIPGQTDTLTVALLAEIDGLKASDNVVVIATTNMLESVDSAVKRSGRLEEKCEVACPREDEIADILKISLKGYKLEDGVNLDSFVASFVSTFRGYTGADIKRVVEKTVQKKVQDMREPKLSEITISKRDIEMSNKELSPSRV